MNSYGSHSYCLCFVFAIVRFSKLYWYYLTGIYFSNISVRHLNVTANYFGRRSPISYLTVRYNSPTRAYSEAKARNILTNDTSLSLCHIESRFAIVTILSRCQCHKLCSWYLDSCDCDSLRWFTVRVSVSRLWRDPPHCSLLAASAPAQ